MNRLGMLIVSAVFAVTALVAGTALADEGYGETQKSVGVYPGLELSVEAGLGYDSNAYLAPDVSYVDLAATGTPTVSPRKQSGIFIPLGLDIDYRYAMSPTSDIIMAYDFYGRAYLDADLDNANEYKNKVRVGPEFTLSGEGRRRSTLYFGAFGRFNNEVYFDRDDGLKKSSSTGVDISSRYNFAGIGGEAEYRNRLHKVRYKVFARFEFRDYEDPVVVSQYDHTYYAIGGKLNFKLADPTKLFLGYKYFVRDYDDRPSRDATGTALTSNPRLEYAYHDFDITLRHRFGKKLVSYLDYSFTLRDDRFVGYNDYSKHKFRVRGIYKASHRLRLRATADIWVRDYDNAFAFDDPTGGGKRYDGLGIDLKGEYAITGRLKAWVDVEYDNQNSTDKRYDYDRSQTMAGLSYNL
ncbi:MAG: hypothetical protein ACE5EI_07490 [Thermodesulfobacteriota bacterium]